MGAESPGNLPAPRRGASSAEFMCRSEWAESSPGNLPAPGGAPLHVYHRIRSAMASAKAVKNPSPSQGATAATARSVQAVTSF